MSVKKLITNISRASLHDGPGVRTVVYLAGCSLRCRWCHNPETLSGENRLAFVGSKCIGCGRCISVCPEHHRLLDGRLRLIREGCTLCGRCTEVCPSKALEKAGKYMTSDEVFEEILKDEHYYKASGGGVTFSGGECLLCPEFVIEVAKKCHECGIHTAVESAFFVPFTNIEAVLPHIDLFFADLKIADYDKHREYTGQGNDRIIENIRRLSKRKVDMIIRIPVIPDVNDSEEDFSGFARILGSLGDAVRYVELLKYNNLAESKYDSIGKEYTGFSDEPQSDERMRELCDLLSQKCGLKCVF